MSRDQIQQLTDAVAALQEGFQHFAAQQLVYQAAVTELVRLNPSKPAIAAVLRNSVHEALAQTAGQPRQGFDAAITLALASLLEAAGQPPQHGPDDA